MMGVWFLPPLWVTSWRTHRGPVRTFPLPQLFGALSHKGFRIVLLFLIKPFAI